MPKWQRCTVQMWIYKHMTIKIHGKEYVTVAERIALIHAEARKNPTPLEITTEILSHNPVVVKATVKIYSDVFTGISAANPAKAIEKQSPYEVAETSAVGRALGFAGYGIETSIASADEIKNATAEGEDF